MSEVVELNSRKRRDLDVWQCKCGSHAFWLYSDGSVNCADCGREAISMHGYWKTPTRAEVQETPLTGNIHAFRNPE
jgi:hypothetical protein